MRYFLELAYCGKAYHGWQIQPNARTVQQTLQDALSTILRSDAEVVGAGRTDTGVHAAFYVAHFDVADGIDDSNGFIHHLNAILPHDIAIRRLRPVQHEAHARFDAVLREYKYYICPQKDPFNREITWQYTVPLHIERMNRAAEYLLTQTDFTSFSKLHSDNRTNICRLKTAHWTEENGLLVFTVSADRFLRNMVRAMVGTLVDVGRGKISEEQFQAVITGRDRGMAGTSAPPQGLLLTRVVYPKSVYLPDIDEENSL